MKFKVRILLALASVACFALVGGVCACAPKESPSEHTEHSYGAWAVTREATCTEAGERSRKCTECDDTQTEPIPALGHVFGTGKVTKAATCTEEGERTYTCSRCETTTTEALPVIDHDWMRVGSYVKEPTCTEAGEGTQKCSICGTERSGELPPLGHLFGDPTVSPAPTCTEDGKQVRKCTRCDFEEVTVLPKYEHRWVIETRNSEPTCTAAGSAVYRCDLCGSEETREIAALGHDYESFYTVDEQATFDHAGSKSYHCKVCGDRSGTVEIPQLHEGQAISYDFRVVRNNGDLIKSSSCIITVKDGENVVATSDRTTLVDGVFTAQLLPKEYTVTVENVPLGYTAAASYTVSPFDPNCNLWLTAAPISSSAPASLHYREGQVMYDFTVPAANSDTGVAVSLSETLRGKKLVVLNFWYVDCGWCQQEFPGLQNAYRNYSDDVAIIAVNGYSTDTLASIRSFKGEYRLTFTMVRDEGLDLVSKFNVTSYPTSVFIDAEGVICEIHTGYTEQAGFETRFKRYISDRYWENGHGASAASVVCTQPECVLPDKRLMGDVL